MIPAPVAHAPSVGPAKLAWGRAVSERFKEKVLVVSRQIVEYVRSGDGGGGMEGSVAVVSGGGGGGGVDIGAEVRRQVSDTPVAMPEPQGLDQAQLSASDLTFGYEHIADKLPIGSTIWWEQMNRERRGGRPG